MVVLIAKKSQKNTTGKSQKVVHWMWIGDVVWLADSSMEGRRFVFNLHNKINAQKLV
jgi:hypothetical protein